MKQWKMKKYVLIVAKCIVNYTNKGKNEAQFQVLIVAKCIVNVGVVVFISDCEIVLIVAKCIVNPILYHIYTFFTKY